MGFSIGLWITSCSNNVSVKSLLTPDSEPESLAVANAAESQAFSESQNSVDVPATVQESQDTEFSSNQLINYERYEQPGSIVHVVQVPNPSSVELHVSLVDGLATVEQHAQDAGAIAAINAGFFDPQNQQTTSYVTIDGAIAADPRENSRLVNNPDLAIYMEAILNRSEFRQLTCDEGTVYSIAHHGDGRSESAISDFPDGATSQEGASGPSCTLNDAVGGGPRLLPTLQSVEEGFLAYDSDGGVIRDAIGSLSPNARSAVGITDTGVVVFVMVAQRTDVGDRMGMSLPELADFLETLGVRDALNLDGGSSSSLYVDGTLHYGRFDAEGTPIQRPVKSVLLVRPLAESN